MQIKSFRYVKNFITLRDLKVAILIVLIYQMVGRQGALICLTDLVFVAGVDKKY